MVHPPSSADDDFIRRLHDALKERYRVERVLGRGGMATVFLAHDLKHSRAVAIKVMHAELSTTIGEERFAREIEVAARLQHPNILPLFDSGSADGLLFYVMPFVEGESLRDMLKRTGPPGLHVALRITREVALALQYAHDRGVIHRDIKPENIMLTGDVATVADFGIARATHAEDGPHLTMTGMVVGTPQYMSPEQAEGAAVGPASDLYSLACVTYEMLAGRPPFGGSQREVLAKLWNEKPSSIRIAAPDIPTAVDEVVQLGLAKSPEQRPRTVMDFATELAAAAGFATSGVTSGRHVGSGRRRVNTRLAVAMVVVIALAAAGQRYWTRVPAASSASVASAAATALPLIAVLTFANLGPPGDAYLAEGLTEEIRSRLASLTHLSVIARSSAGRADASRPVDELGRSLGVQYVLTGSVLVEHNAEGKGNFRVIPRLTRVSDRRVLPIEPIDGSLNTGEMLKANSRIAQAVGDELGIAIQPLEREVLESQPTSNLMAYNAYLKASALSDRLFDEGAKRAAIEAYRAAVTADPHFALAFARLAGLEASYFAQFGRAPERLDSAQANANRALALDSTLAEAHLAAGYVAYFGFLDFDRALAEFERVRKTQPNNGELLTILATIQMHMGRWQDARTSFLRAIRTAPRSPDAIAPLASIETMLGHHEEAERLADRELELAPDYLAGHVQRSYSRLSRGDTAGGRAALREAARKMGSTPVLIALVHRFRHTLWYFDPALGDSLAALRPGIAGMDSGSYYSARSQVAWQRGDSRQRGAFADSARLIWETRLRRSPKVASYHIELAHTYVALGRMAEARREAERAVTLLPMSKDAYLGSFVLTEAAFVDAASGATEAAIDRFEQLLSRPAPISPQLLGIDSRLSALHANPRFQRLLDRSMRSPAS